MICKFVVDTRVLTKGRKHKLTLPDAKRFQNSFTFLLTVTLFANNFELVRPLRPLALLLVLFLLTLSFL